MTKFSDIRVELLQKHSFMNQQLSYTISTNTVTINYKNENMNRVVNILIFLSRFCLITSGKGSGSSKTFFWGGRLGASDGNGWGSDG